MARNPTDRLVPMDGDLASTQQHIEPQTGPGSDQSRTEILEDGRIVNLETGEVTTPPDESVRTGGPSLSKQLDGDVPVVLFVRGARLSQHFADTLPAADRATRGQVGIGAVLPLLNAGLDARTQFLRQFTTNRLLLADPELFRAERSQCPDAKTLGPRAGRRSPWFVNAPAQDSPTDPAWVTEVLRVQRNAGATALVSATGWVDNAAPQRAMQHAMRWVSASRSQAPDEPMFVNLTFDHVWLTNPTLRNVLLHELVESSESLWYLRFRWPLTAPRFGQLVDPKVLDGYKELCSTAALEGKNLILPNSGLTGWVMSAIGATGFSTGIGWSEQAYADQPRFGSTRQNWRPPRVRYFESSVLHTVEHAAHLTMMGEPSYALCSCDFCRRLPLSAPTSAGWNKEVAGQHYLIATAALSSVLASRRPRLAAQRMVNDARTMVQKIASGPTPLAGDNLPKHLDRWLALLR